MKKQTTRFLTRAGVIGALYAALTFAFLPYAYGPLQIRPAEALTVLPAFFSESVPGLYVGCMIANLGSSSAGIWDVVFGSLVTLIAALLSRKMRHPLLVGIPPVVLNAFGIPLILVLAGGLPWGAYFTVVGQIALTQTLWVYGLGLPLYFYLKKMKDKGKKL